MVLGIFRIQLGRAAVLRRGQDRDLLPHVEPAEIDADAQVVRVGLARADEYFFRLLQVALPLQGKRQAREKEGSPLLEKGSLPEDLSGVVVPLVLQVRLAQGVERRRILRVVLDRVLELGRALLLLARLAQEFSEPGERLRVLWIQLERGLVLHERAVGAFGRAEPLEGGREVVVRLRAVWIELLGLAEEVERFPDLSLPEHGDPLLD